MSITNGFAVENRIWDPVETIPRTRLASLQLYRLKTTLARVAKVPFYQQAFATRGIQPEAIDSLEALRELPFTTKDDLRLQYPLGLLAVPRDQVARFHGSSGTTGKPTFVAYTKGDLQTWADLCARFLVAGGLRPQYTAHVAFGYGLFTGGFGLHGGIERVGAAVVPAASGNTQRQIGLIQDLQSEVLICTPSYALTLAEGARELGLDPRALPLRLGHFGGEPWTQDMRRQIEEALGLVAFNNYGLSEVIGPGVSGECAVRDGLHIQEDQFLVECLDPHTLEPVPDGEPGELVFTTLTKQAMPLIRYRTRDIARLHREPCPCGRVGARMGWVSGRTDDMLIIRGVNVFPSQFEAALLRVSGASAHYLIEVERPGTLDEVTLHLEPRVGLPVDELATLEKRATREVQNLTGIRARVRLVPPQSLARSEGKAQRVLDRRGLGGETVNSSQ